MNAAAVLHRITADEIRRAINIIIREIEGHIESVKLLALAEACRDSTS